MISLTKAWRDWTGNLLSVPSAVQSETIAYYRIDQTKITSEEIFQQLLLFAAELRDAVVGHVLIYGEISGEINLETSSFADVEGELLSVILSKNLARHTIFVTEAGFLRAIESESDSLKDVVWVASDFDEFATYAMLVAPWGGPTERPPNQRESLPSPRKLVRDHTHRLTPAKIEPWLLVARPKKSSTLFEKWQEIAAVQLSFCLPFEIIESSGDLRVILKGPRSTEIPMASSLVGTLVEFECVSDAASWIYSSSRDADTRFAFFNYHLSLDWLSEERWPIGLTRLVGASMVAAREAFAFHLQDKSKEALKSLSDLRKSLQDEVSKTQQSTRDLVSALWRDFAIAAGVLALRYLPGSTSIPIFWLKLLTLSSGALLLMSISVTLWTNYRFNKGAKVGREEWRSRIYGFIEPAEWARLVVEPLQQTLTTYRLVASVVAAMYAAIIGYLLYVSDTGPAIWRGMGAVWSAAKNYCGW